MRSLFTAPASGQSTAANLARLPGQRIGVASQKPATVWLFAVYSDSIAGQLRCISAGARCNGQRVPTKRVGDFANDHDIVQFTYAMDPRSLVGGREIGRKSIPANRCSAWDQKHDLVRHQSEQASRIAGVDSINPGCVHLTNGLLIGSHPRSPPPNSLITRQVARRPAPISVFRIIAVLPRPECRLQRPTGRCRLPQVGLGRLTPAPQRGSGRGSEDRTVPVASGYARNLARVAIERDGHRHPLVCVASDEDTANHLVLGAPRPIVRVPPGAEALGLRGTPVPPDDRLPLAGFAWWAVLDSNQRPRDYESVAELYKTF